MLPIKQKMLAALSEAQKLRQTRSSFVSIETPWGYKDTVPEWNLFEMTAMRDIVNREREKNKLPLITLLDIRRVESMACGHSDYSSKFALYCAELTQLKPDQIKA